MGSFNGALGTSISRKQWGSSSFAESPAASPQEIGQGTKEGTCPVSACYKSTIRTPPCCSLGGQEVCGSEMGCNGRGMNNLGTGEIEPWQRFLL